jgi:carboxylesterase type B
MYGPDFLITEEVVIVTTNYRLGFLGFLSLKDPSLGVPGNAGLKDIVMALKWVQKNIHNFGGDPNNVTICGGSTGGVAVHLLTLSPMSKDLFHKAIAQSGCAMSPWAQTRRGVEKIAPIMNLEGSSERTIYEHLMQLSVENIYNIQEKFAMV